MYSSSWERRGPSDRWGLPVALSCTPPLVCSDVSVSAHMQTVRWRHLTTGAIARRKSPSELASLGLQELCFYMPLYSLQWGSKFEREDERHARRWANLQGRRREIAGTICEGTTPTGWNKDLRKTDRDHGWGTVNRNFKREEWRERDEVMQKKNDWERWNEKNVGARWCGTTGGKSQTGVGVK